MNQCQPILWVLILAVAPAACGAAEKLSLRVDLLEKDFADLKRAQDRALGQLDELQIQLSLLSRRFGGASGGSAKTEADSASGLSVVKLHPGLARQPPPPKVVSPLKVTEFDERSPTDRLPVQPPPQGASQQQVVPDAGEDPPADLAVIAREFARAFTPYRQGQYQKAIGGFRVFLSQHAKSDLAADAQFYLAKAELELGKLGEAQGDLRAVVDQFPKSKWAAEALLLQGRCYERAGNLGEARGAYLQLVEAYPLSAEATEANQRLEAIR